MYRKLSILCAATVSAGLAFTASAREEYLDDLLQNFIEAPNACSVCHVTEDGGSARNAFGQDVDANRDGTTIDWTAVGALDSDGDGTSNADELDLGEFPVESEGGGGCNQAGGIGWLALLALMAGSWGADLRARQHRSDQGRIS